VTEPLLSVEGLHVRIGPVHAVRGLSFELERGRTIGIVGESGCGKTMTALAVMGLLPEGARRQAGRLALDGADLLGLTEREAAGLRGRRMAMVFQDPMSALNPVFTVGDQLEEAWLEHNRGGRRSDARGRALALLERVGVNHPSDRLRQYPHELSGGIAQRVMIAMALMCGPALLVADEPTTALDVTVQAQVLRLLRNLQEEFALGILLITHDLGVVAHMASTVLVMYAGELVETGTAREVFRRPAHPYTRGLLGALPVPGSHAARLAVIPGSVPSLAAHIKGCAFRGRCPYASDACADPVPMRQVAPGRGVRCVLPYEGGQP
jgi:peptide/nickel transport system ATP-binding protein